MAEEAGRGSAFAQLVCLLSDLIFTLVSSAVRSLRLIWSSRSSSSRQSRGFELYQGRVWHERRHPKAHRFEYNVRYVLVDLDSIPDWFRDGASHLTAAEARKIAGTDGSVRLLTIPSSVGYEQNPLSVYYCHENKSNAVVKCIAEVTNTPWAERVTFVFQPGLDMVPKPLHVSPFMDMLGIWRMKVSQPAEDLQIVIDVQHPELGNYFSAVLKLRWVEDADPKLFFWLMPHKAAFWIYWHALLLILKGVPFIGHPKYYDGIAYRENARNRDEELRNLQNSTESSGAKRYCAWREAPCWPWR